ncbi:MAG: hypothetical protein M3Y66_02855 [Actinomycetota bacterium]|nr:hypothetical protein [Actinomycetota bacterium]
MSERSRTRPRTLSDGYVVALLALTTVVARLPFLADAPGLDEAGYLLVGHQWTAGGTSLYGNFWVDRPPLLITLFRLAALTGGLLPLRLLGCLAVVLVVVGAALVARQVAGELAGRWAAVAAAVLCVSPLLGGMEVNGELLSAPFVLGGMAAALAALRAERHRRVVVSASLAGAATVAALLVKQNFADVAVFATVVFVLARRRGEISRARLGRIVVGYVVGAAVCLGAIAAWTLLHGTSLTGVFDAMYPFRIRAGQVLAATDRQSASGRLWGLLGCWLLSGCAIVMAFIAWGVTSRRMRDVASWGLVATVIFDVMSIVLGGGYWLHYLVQLIGPVSIAAGVLVARRQPGTRTLLGIAAVSAVIAWGLAVPKVGDSTGSTIGHAVAKAAAQGDTIITVYGHSEVTFTSGLSSPYPYLWSLPGKTLDPQHRTLDRILRGPSAPTWFVTWDQIATPGAATKTTGQLIMRRYHRVARFDGRTIYLRNGVVRPALSLPRTLA